MVVARLGLVVSVAVVVVLASCGDPGGESNAQPASSAGSGGRLGSAGSGNTGTSGMTGMAGEPADAGNDADADPEPRAYDFSFVPSNLPADLSSLTPPESALDVDWDGCDDANFNTDTGQLTCGGLIDAEPGTRTDFDFRVATQIDGPEVAILLVSGLKVPELGRLGISGSRPLVILSAGDVEIAGTVSASANISVPGSGGFPLDGMSGPGAGEPSLQEFFGPGGGASYCTVGGAGVAPYGGAGGMLYGNASITPLIGGSEGGNSGGADSTSFGGGGGGAIQIVSATSITVTATGKIKAGGGGGRSGLNVPDDGHGGGSGGSILLEAPNVDIEGAVAANGGSGSCVDEGADATEDATPASAPCGGDGAAGDQPAADGVTSADDDRGGGGGGAGRIRINTMTGTAVIASNAIISPAASTDCISEGTLPDSESASAGAIQ